MQTTFNVEIRFWLEDLGVRFYKNHVSRSKI